MRNRKLLLAAAIVTAAAPAAVARPVQTGTPAQVQQLIACRSIAGAEQRLACYDRQVTAMQQAISSRDLVMIDKERVREAGRSLFGFTIPNFGGIFGGNGEISQIDATIKGTGHNSDGGWLITLDDGSVWTQTDDWPGLDARPGKKVIVKRGVLGSYWLSIPGQNGIKVKRVG